MGIYSDNRSLKEAHAKKKSLESLTAENKALKERLQTAETQLVDTQLALCDAYELVLGGDTTNG